MKILVSSLNNVKERDDKKKEMKKKRISTREKIEKRDDMIKKIKKMRDWREVKN